MKHLLILLISILLSSPLFGQSERPETIIIPVSSMGDVSDTRKKIIQNTLTQELSKHFQILPQDRFEQVQEQVFNELEYDECTEDQCIMRIQEILQIENTFHLEMIGEEGDTQLNLKWINLDEKRNREDYCEDCKTKELRKRVVGLVEKLVGVKEEVVVEKPPVKERKVEQVIHTKQWTRQLGTSSGDEGYEVTVDSSDNIYVTGYTKGGLDGNTYLGGSFFGGDIFLVKYNSSDTKQLRFFQNRSVGYKLIAFA